MLRIISLSLLLVCGAAHADDMLLLGVGQKGGGSSYQGPGNIVSGATAFYGLRAYNAAYATGSNNAINVRRASDNSTSNIVILSNGNLDVATAASFAGTDATASCSTTGSSTSLICTGASSTPNSNDPISGTGITQPAYITSCGTFTTGAGTCTMNVAQNIGVAETVTFHVALFVTEAYDQSGNGYHATQGSASNQPQLLPYALNSATDPGILFSGGQHLVANPPSIMQPWTFFAVAERTNSVNSWITGNVGQFNIGYGSFSNLAEFYAGTIVTITLSDNVLHSIQTIGNGAASVINLDGSASTNNIGSSSTNGTIGIGSDNSGFGPLTGYLAELIFYPIAANSTQQGNIYTNQKAYWGTP
jgi:hypothetical protein